MNKILIGLAPVVAMGCLAVAGMAMQMPSPAPPQAVLVYQGGDELTSALDPAAPALTAPLTAIGEQNSGVIVVSPAGTATHSLAPLYGSGEIDTDPTRRATTIGRNVQELLTATASTDRTTTDREWLALLDNGCEQAHATAMKQVIMVFNPLSTQAPIDTRRGLWDMTPTEVTRQSDAQGYLPDCTQLTVTVLLARPAAGSVQDPITPPVEEWLNELVDTVAHAAGADDVSVNWLPAAPPTSGAAAVPVPVPAPVAITPEGDCQVQAVAFKSNSARLADPAGTRQMLADCVGQLSTRRKVTVTGHTADDGTGDGRALSQDRAEEIADLLVDLGISRDQMRVRGVGSAEPLPGLPGSDPANRRVVVSGGSSR